MFVSLRVLHEPDEWELRGAWAAGVRSRLSADNRDFLKQILPATTIPLTRLYQLPEPKDSQSVLDGLAGESAESRFQILHPLFSRTILDEVSAARRWESKHIRAIQRRYKQIGSTLSKKSTEAIFAWWLDVELYGERLMSALTAFRSNFYAEEERRIAPYLAEALGKTQQTAQNTTLPQLLEAVSRGVRLSIEELDRYERTILVPSFWATPFLIKGMSDSVQQCIYLYGARPDNASLVPGDVIPDALYRSLKALAEPTRLKILRYLSAEPHTPTQLANKLRLRPPTVIHHLRTLRLAQLVQVTMTDGGKRYAARDEAVDETLTNLRQFLNA